MNTTYILLLVTVSCSLASCQTLPALASLMQEILSQSNPDIKGTAAKNIGTPEYTVNRRSVVQEAGMPRPVEMAMPVQRPAIVETAVPKAVIRNEAAPRTVIVQKGNEMGVPRNVVVQARETATPRQVIVQKPNEYAVRRNVVVQKEVPNKMVVQKANERPMKMVMQNGNEVITNQVIVKKPELPNKVLLKTPEVTNRKMLVQKAGEIPMMKNFIITGSTAVPAGVASKRVIVQQNNGSPVRTVSDVEFVPEMVVKQPRVVEYVTKERVVAVNPFLPAASPVSPMTSVTASTGSVPQARGQYLRKIPIPPPTI